MGRLQPIGPKRQAGGALGTPLCTRGAWADCLPGGWTHPSAHVAIGSYLSDGHNLHTWRLGCVGLGTSGAWVMAPDSREMDWAS
jgi:hypothetical protein